MAVALESAVRALLLPADDVKIVLKAHIATNSDAESPGNASLDHHEPRFAAIVSHRDVSSSHEEGSIFVLRRGFANDAELEIQRVLPIYKDASFSLAQSRRDTIDLSKPSEAALKSPRTGFELNIISGPGVSPLVVRALDVQKLQNFMAECKRFEQAAPARTADNFSWILPYTLGKNTQPIISSTPPDLRTASQPLHMQLSEASAGLPGDDAADALLIRSHWLRTRAREVCHRGSYPLRIRIGTFNVNGKAPTQDIGTWIGTATEGAAIERLGGNTKESLHPDNRSSSSSAIELTRELSASSIDHSSSAETAVGDLDNDILVLGFQELDLSTEALIYSTGTAKEDAWCAAVFDALGPQAAQYVKLGSKQLVGMLIVIIVRKALRSAFSDVRVCAAGAGIMGIMGNKGGTAIRVKFTPPAGAGVDGSAQSKPEGHTYHASVLTFVNAHLAAFDEMVERRHADFHDLSRRLAFGADLHPSAEGSGSSNVNTTGQAMISVYESDALFWLGDLNYRVDLPDADMRTMLRTWPKECKYSALLKYDQLRNAIKNKRAFASFTEADVMHEPTYRFSAGLLTDDLGYDMKRRPAWTDRILHLSGSTEIRQLTYVGHPEITLSDHRPVSATFEVDVPIIDQREHDATLRDLLRQISSVPEDEHRPALAVDDDVLDFGTVQYMRSVSKLVSIKNTGKLPCAFRFVPLELGASICPQWLQVAPLAGFLLPGERTSITVTLNIDTKAAAQLNPIPKLINAALILHTALGKDHFISVSAEYQPTCFANSLQFLTRLPGAIRSLRSEDELLPEARARNASGEIMRLVQWMMGIADVTRVLSLRSDESTLDTIRECLDTGSDFPFAAESNDPQLARAFWDSLIRLLCSLTEPIVPYRLHSRCSLMTSRDEAFELLGELTPAAINVWISITAFLQYVCASSPSPKDMARRISCLYAPVLIPDDPAPAAKPISPLAKADFLLYFISS